LADSLPETGIAGVAAGVRAFQEPHHRPVRSALEVVGDLVEAVAGKGEHEHQRLRSGAAQRVPDVRQPAAMQIAAVR